MSHSGSDSSPRICIKLVRDPNISMPQCAARGVDAVGRADLRAVFFPQRVQRLIRFDSLLPQPLGELLEILLARVVLVSDLRLRRSSRLKHKISGCPCAVSPENFHEFRVNLHVADCILTLWVEISGRLDSDHLGFQRNDGQSRRSISFRLVQP